MPLKHSSIEQFPPIFLKIKKWCVNGIISVRSSVLILSTTHRYNSTFFFPIKIVDKEKVNKTSPLHMARFRKITTITITSSDTVISILWWGTTLVPMWRRKTPCCLLVSKGTCGLTQTQPDSQPGILPEDAFPEPGKTRGTHP